MNYPYFLEERDSLCQKRAKEPRIQRTTKTVVRTFLWNLHVLKQLDEYVYASMYTCACVPAHVHIPMCTHTESLEQFVSCVPKPAGLDLAEVDDKFWTIRRPLGTALARDENRTSSGSRGNAVSCTHTHVYVYLCIYIYVYLLTPPHDTRKCILLVPRYPQSHRATDPEILNIQNQKNTKLHQSSKNPKSKNPKLKQYKL